MRIFVTGALGFIGAHFVEKALAAGNAVVGLYRSAPPDKEALLGHLTALGANMRRGDILDVNSYEDALRGVDCVCHFAAAFKEANAPEEFFHRANVEGMLAVLEAAARRGVRRFVLCSTAGIYGQRIAGVADERAAPRPFNRYERSKLAAEQALRSRAAALGMEYVTLRPTVVYGPRDDRLLKLFKAAVKGRFPLFGNGDGRRHMVYVTDVAEAFLRACVEPQAANQELIVAGPKAVPLKVMLQTLARVVKRSSCGPKLPLKPMVALAGLIEDSCRKVGVKPPIYRRRMDFYVSDAAFDCARARQVLGWEPRVDLEEGLRRTVRQTAQDSPRRATPVIALPILAFSSQTLWHWSGVVAVF